MATTAAAVVSRTDRVAGSQLRKASATGMKVRNWTTITTVVGGAQPHEVLARLGRPDPEGLRQHEEEHEQHVGHQPGDAGGQSPRTADRWSAGRVGRVSVSMPPRFSGEVSRCHGTMSRSDRDSFGKLRG